MRLPRRIAFGTMHGKAAAVAPPLAGLGIELVVPESFDTDRFGTFAGDIPRAGTMIEAARAKAREAAAATGLPVGLASEGAYGPHPAVPFLPVGRELLLWHEQDTGREILAWMIDDSPVHDHVTLSDPCEAEAFLRRVGFPATALIVLPAACRAAPVARGVTDAGTLARAVAKARAASPDGRALVQTDMRADRNPRRMAVIGDLAARMAARLAARCPVCGAPGWGEVRVQPGLPCAACGLPTPLPKAAILGCTACGHEATIPAAGVSGEADPAMCPCCNP